MTRMCPRMTIPGVIVAAILLSACGSPSSSVSITTGPSTRTVYLCQVIPRVDRLAVSRHQMGSQFIFTFPAFVTVSSASAAQAVAKFACALPNAPKGAQACPVEFAVWYHLVFAVRGEKGTGVEAIDVNPTGCQSVEGLEAVREVMSHPAFFRVLGRAMGLKNSSYLTFRGAFRIGG